MNIAGGYRDPCSEQNETLPVLTASRHSTSELLDQVTFCLRERARFPALMVVTT